MASLTALKNLVSQNLPDDAGTGPKPKITPSKHREEANAIIDEFKLRGIVESTINNLSTLPGTETDKVFVSGYGLFKYVANGLVVDNITVFAAQTSGFWQLQKAFSPKMGVNLVPGVLVPVDLSQGDVFKLSIDGDSVIGIPSGFKYNGKRIRFQITQTGAGGFQALFNTNVGGYAFSFHLPPPDYTGQAAGEVNWVEFEYSEDILKWVCVRQYAQIS